MPLQRVDVLENLRKPVIIELWRDKFEEQLAEIITYITGKAKQPCSGIG